MIKQILKKSFLLIIGLLCSVLLETAMWTHGFASQGYADKELKYKPQYIVMCLGESFTQQQYPIPLQQMLQLKYPGKFSIIDCGRSGVNFRDILQSLDENIKQYHPDIVIFLMGGITVIRQNDETDGNTSQYDSAFKNKLERILLEADSLSRKGQYQQIVKILTNFLKQYPENETAFAYLTETYFYNMPEFKDTGYKMALKSLKSGRTFQRGALYQKLIIYNLEKNNIRLAKQFTAELLNEENTKIDMILYGTIKNLITPEQKEKILKKLQKDKNDIFYGVMAIESIQNKDFKKAEEFFNAAEELRINFPNEQTNIVYRAIIQKLVDNNIKVICMQYPLRSIKPLQNILKNEPYYGKITFVSNELNFKQALREKKYYEVFRDQYGGDFGHCTNYGNTLIAQNVAKTLTDLTKND